MEIIDSRVESAGPRQIRIITTVDFGNTDSNVKPEEVNLGAGPTEDAIPDRIVRYLISCAPNSADLKAIYEAVGGNRATVNRQAWTLAHDAPDLQLRLRGWVVSVDRGRYALSPQARRLTGLHSRSSNQVRGR